MPELGYRVCQKHRGITSRVVERLIAKRRKYKELGVRGSGLGIGGLEPVPFPIGNWQSAIGNPIRGPNRRFKIQDSRFKNPDLFQSEIGNRQSVTPSRGPNRRFKIQDSRFKNADLCLSTSQSSA